MASVCCAGDSSTDAALRQTLSQVPAAELPAKAAELVKAAKTRDRGFLTADIVTISLSINPVATPAIVAAISHSVPDMASIAAGTAAELQPKLAPDIAKAASAAAPSRAGKIVVAVCRAAPQQYEEIAAAAAQVAPGSSQEILRAVASLYPELKPGIDHALAGYSGAPPSVTAVLDSTKSSASPGTIPNPASPRSGPAGARVVAGSFGVRGSPIAPPYVAPSSTATNINPANSVNVPRGGRNYAAP